GHHHLLTLLVGIACSLLPLIAVAAQTDIAEDKTLTPEREAAAMTFAKAHHPELADLLVGLKRMDEPRYATAVNELFRTSERLAKSKSRSVERYELELSAWRVDSRIRLLTAQSVSGMPDSRREELKRLLLQRRDIKVQMLLHEKSRLESRVAKIDTSIDELQENADEQAEKELDRLLKSVKPRATSVQPKPSLPKPST
ncbi:MAG: hypothetical protein KDA58_17060, partial [Planctomycetaceae bacterium]|nr:hypothetical protein [Planctomycetaceae bacterium]